MKQKPYNLLFWTGIILILASFFNFKQSNAIDIHFHDTYIVIANTHFFWLLSILALFEYALYLLTHKILYSKTLTWAHVIITILTILLFVLTHFFGNSFMNPAPRLYYDYSDWNSFNNYTAFGKGINLAIVGLMFGQFVFVINFIVGIFKKLTKLDT